MLQGTLWQHRAAGTPSLWVFLKDHERFNVMGFSGNNLIWHDIHHSQEEIQKLTEINPQAKWLRLTHFEQPFVSPSKFHEALPHQIQTLKTIPLDASISLSFDHSAYIPQVPNEELVHPLKTLYQFSRKRASKPAQMFVVPHEQMVTILFTLKEKLLLANTYPAENEAAVLYFSVAPLRKFGIEPAECNIQVLQTEEWMHRNKDNFGRYLPEATLWKIMLPYPDNQFPPFELESHLLLLTAECALQEDF